MSELIPKPTFGLEPEAVVSLNHPTETGAVGSASSVMTVRYHADADSSDPGEAPEAEADPGETEALSQPERRSGALWSRVRVLLGVLASILGAITKAGIQGAVRYPRFSVCYGKRHARYASGARSA